MTITSGGDNLGVYIPYFTAFKSQYLGLVLLVFFLGIIILIELSRWLTKLSSVSEIIEEFERIMVPL